MKTAIEMAGEVLDRMAPDDHCCEPYWTATDEELERLVELARADAIADEREACEKMCEEFARKWWKIHCDSNLHYSSTLKAHQDFCALQAAIRARNNT